MVLCIYKADCKLNKMSLLFSTQKRTKTKCVYVKDVFIIGDSLKNSPKYKAKSKHVFSV